VAKRLDVVIGCHCEVRGASLDHAQNRGKDATNRSDFLPVGIARRRQGVVVPEQFVSAVNEMNFQSCPEQTYKLEPGKSNRGRPWVVACFDGEKGRRRGAFYRRTRGADHASRQAVFFGAGASHKIGSCSLLSVGGAGGAFRNQRSPRRPQAIRQW